MGKKEHPLIWYYGKNLHFAELLNGWLFRGKQKLQADHIRDMDRRYLAADSRKKYRERYRDVFKQVQGIGIRLLIGLEEQEHVHYAMPVRVMDYEAVAYLEQLDQIKSGHREREDLKDRDEWLSGFAAEDRLCPVITLVLYCGSHRPWDGAQSVGELLDLSGLPVELKEYVEDYRIHVLDVCHTPDERLKEFPPDIRVMFLFMKNQNNAEELEKQLAGEEAIHTDTYDVIADYLEVPELKAIKRKVKEGETCNMCQAIKELIANGEKRGIELGSARERANTEKERTRAERERARAEQAEARVRELEEKLALLGV